MEKESVITSNQLPPNIKDTDKFMQTKFIKELREFYNDFWVDTSKDGDLGLIISVRGTGKWTCDYFTYFW